MAVHLTRIYTRTGDAGQTSLGDGSRVPKTDPRIEAYADRFLRQMVRAIVGTLTEIGMGARTAGSLEAVLGARK